MKYMGSKSRIAKYILPIILQNRTEGQFYVEPFVGGANIIDKVIGNRIGADSNEYVIALLQSMESGWIPKDNYTREEYYDIKKNKDRNKAESGYVGINLSYSGGWFRSFAGLTKTKTGYRDYQKEANNNVIKQSLNLKGINFLNKNYNDLSIPDKSIIYCDPPYEGTTGYKDKFNHDAFWEWCRKMKQAGHTVFVSEYNAPDDFICVWSMELSSSLSSNGKSGGNKKSIEKLFKL